MHRRQQPGSADIERKSPVIAARMLPRLLGTPLTIRPLVIPHHRRVTPGLLRKTCIGHWCRSSNQLRKRAKVLRDCCEGKLVLRAAMDHEIEAEQAARCACNEQTASQPTCYDAAIESLGLGQGLESFPAIGRSNHLYQHRTTEQRRLTSATLALRELPQSANSHMIRPLQRSVGRLLVSARALRRRFQNYRAVVARRLGCRLVAHSQITPTIIIPDPVDVLYPTFWEFAGHPPKRGRARNILFHRY
jgi:hypothetical protein